MNLTDEVERLARIGLTATEVAEELGARHGTVRQSAWRHGVLFPSSRGAARRVDGMRVELARDGDGWRAVGAGREGRGATREAALLAWRQA